MKRGGGAILLTPDHGYVGRLVVDAISNRDYAHVRGGLLPIGLTYVLVNLLTDVVYPRSESADAGMNSADDVFVLSS